MPTTDKLKSLFADYMKGVEDPEVCKQLAEISKEIDAVDSKFTELETKHAKMKDEYIEALKHSSFKGTETPPEPSGKSSFDEALAKLKGELNNGK